jgi:NADPH:quinone reductase-like Zn-dependent oxidoreductase
MRAVIITRPGGPEVLELQERPTPTPAANEVLVRVRASALNRADLLQRAGNYPAPPGAPPDIPGLEFAGAVAELGAGVTSWSKGDRVFGVTAGGGNAEYLVADEGTVARIPNNLSWTDAAVEGWNTHAKMNPPLRDPEDVAAVRQGLADGTIDAI